MPTFEFTDEAELARLKAAYETLHEHYMSVLATNKQHSDGGVSITNYELETFPAQLCEMRRGIRVLQRRIKKKADPTYVPLNPNKRSAVLKGDLC